MNINRNNYETFFLLSLDKELSSTEQGDLENFLVENADLRKEFNLLQLTIQKPAEIVFEQKELLFRTEEKRRILPVYWTRIAAAGILVLAASWFVLTVIKNNNTILSGSEQAVTGVGTNKKHRDPALPAIANQTKKEPQAGMNHSPEINGQKENAIEKSNGKTPATETKRKEDQLKNSRKEQDHNGKGPGQIQQITSPTQQIQDSPGDEVVVMQKSKTTAELQNKEYRNAVVTPGQSPSVAKPPSLLITAAGINQLAANENEELTDIQTDNSISVIALNEQNKGITSFFKKITNRMPGNETAENTKKLRVSVFQFSY